MTSGKTVLVAGSANLDLVVRTPRIPAPGETVLGRDFAMFPGGKGANQAVASARAGGARTRMLVALGEDAFAASLEGSLLGAGVELDLIRVADQPTGIALICLSDEAENAITVAPGANLALRAGHLPPLAGISHLLMQLESPLESVIAWAEQARVAGVEVVLNAAPARALPDGLLSAVDLLIVNEGELAAIAGIADDIAAALSHVDVPGVIVTLGARGCCARIDGGFLLQSGYEVDAIDTTGAGDTFCGTLVAALARGLPMEEVLRRACAASALACTRLGAQSSVPAASEVEALLSSGKESYTRDALARYCGLAN